MHHIITGDLNTHSLEAGCLNSCDPDRVAVFATGENPKKNGPSVFSVARRHQVMVFVGCRVLKYLVVYDYGDGIFLGLFL